MNREQLVLAIIRHVIDSREISDKEVELIWELIFALTWSKDTCHLAISQMKTVVDKNNEERANRL
jgi:hypothetical protein